MLPYLGFEAAHLFCKSYIRTPCTRDISAHTDLFISTSLCFVRDVLLLIFSLFFSSFFMFFFSTYFAMLFIFIPSFHSFYFCVLVVLSFSRPVIHLIMNSLALVKLNYINIFIFQTHYIAKVYL